MPGQNKTQRIRTLLHMCLSEAGCHSFSLPMGLLMEQCAVYQKTWVDRKELQMTRYCLKTRHTLPRSLLLTPFMPERFKKAALTL